MDPQTLITTILSPNLKKLIFEQLLQDLFYRDLWIIQTFEFYTENSVKMSFFHEIRAFQDLSSWLNTL